VHSLSSRLADQLLLIHLGDRTPAVVSGCWWVDKVYNAVCLSLKLPIWEIEPPAVVSGCGWVDKVYDIVCLSLQVWEIEHRQSSVAAGGWNKVI